MRFFGESGGDGGRQAEVSISLLGGVSRALQDISGGGAFALERWYGRPEWTGGDQVEIEHIWKCGGRWVVE